MNVGIFFFFLYQLELHEEKVVKFGTAMYSTFKFMAQKGKSLLLSKKDSITHRPICQA